MSTKKSTSAKTAFALASALGTAVALSTAAGFPAGPRGRHGKVLWRVTGR